MRWVTRHGPHVDRYASIWLNRTVIEPDALYAELKARAEGTVRLNDYER